MHVHVWGWRVGVLGACVHAPGGWGRGRVVFWHQNCPWSWTVYQAYEALPLQEGFESACKVPWKVCENNKANVQKWSGSW